MRFHRPGKSEHQNVLNYIENQKPVDDKDSEYVYCKEDLITLRPGRELAWFDRAIAKLLRYANCRLIRVSKSRIYMNAKLIDLIVDVLRKGSLLLNLDNRIRLTVLVGDRKEIVRFKPGLPRQGPH